MRKCVQMQARKVSHLMRFQSFTEPSCSQEAIQQVFSILYPAQITLFYFMFCSCDFSQFQHISQVQQCSAPLLLSLIEKSSEDFTLCHSLMSVLIQVSFSWISFLSFSLSLFWIVSLSPTHQLHLSVSSASLPFYHFFFFFLLYLLKCKIE